MRWIYSPLVLLGALAATARGEPPLPIDPSIQIVPASPSAPPPQTQPGPPAAPPNTADGSPTVPCDTITAGDPNVAENLWQRTWGEAGVYVYPVGNKMAPNGVPYDPLFTLDLLLNIALTADRSLYLFTDARFWTQKAMAGVTNPNQGVLDFSKRQFDLDGGIAWNYTGAWEARAELYSYNNLNRGTSLTAPAGYNDGFGLENRYYLPSTNFDKGIYRFLSLGYYITKTMTGQDGQPFDPGLFARASLALDIVQDRLYLYSDTTVIAKRAADPKLLLADWGVAMRPFANIPDLEFRIGTDNTYDMQVGIWRALLYGNVRIIW